MYGKEKLSKDTILVVDDTPDNLALLNEMLKSHYRVKLASDGEQALELVSSGAPPDLILLDIMMPVMDGYEVCMKIKSQSAYKDIPIIFISALADTANIIKAFQCGGVDYVTKPFQFEEVFARVKTHLELRHTQAELQTLLSKTLTGSVRVMLDVLALTHPSVVKQSNNLRRYTKEMMNTLQINSQEAWMMELAAMLFGIGCIAIPADVMQRKATGFALTTAEIAQVQSFPAISGEIVSRIPRMENVAKIISNQMMPLSEVTGTEDDAVFIGSMLLNMILEYDQLLLGKYSSQAAAEVVTTRVFHSCPKTLLSSFLAMTAMDTGKNQSDSV